SHPLKNRAFARRTETSGLMGRFFAKLHRAWQNYAPYNPEIAFFGHASSYARKNLSRLWTSYAA
ncbi:MAG: hypothetical protein L0H15_10625, partial [Nitrosospira sp.]|nr:hypothetical protein [Nitrosospira sp.]